MSVLDFYVTNEGYMVNSHLHDDDIKQVLDESVTGGPEPGQCIDRWCNDLRALASQVYELEHNTDMHPLTVAEFESLNSHIRELSDAIADTCCFVNACYMQYANSNRHEYVDVLRPHLIHIMAHRADIVKYIANHPFGYYLDLNVLSDTYRLVNTAAPIASELEGGLSKTIIDIPTLLEIRDEYALEVMYPYKSFSELFQTIFGDSSAPKSPFVYRTTMTTIEQINSIIDHVRSDLRDTTGVECAIAVPHKTSVFKFTSFKSVAKVTIDNLDDIYVHGGNIPDTAYQNLIDAASTVINEFNALWLISCTMMLDVANDIRKCDMAKSIVNALFTIMSSVKLEPTEDTDDNESAENSAE